jgi:hypothetical protein
VADQPFSGGELNVQVGSMASEIGPEAKTMNRTARWEPYSINKSAFPILPSVAEPSRVAESGPILPI